jgi:hypothetical protein
VERTLLRSEGIKLQMRRTISLLRLALIIAVPALCSSLLLAQNSQLQTRNGRRFPTIIFTYVFWNANPFQYAIAIDSTGAVTYQSAPTSVDRTGVPYGLRFQANDSTRRVIFNVARNLDFFRGNLPVRVSSPQVDPVRSLTYRDLTSDNLITYSGSSDSDIQELTSIFEDISNTLEYGRTLTYFQQRQKGSLDAELTVMQRETERHHLRELQAIAPVLRGIAADENVSEEARTHARALLNTVH